MEPVRKRYGVDQKNQPVAGQLNLAAFQLIENLFEDHGRIQSMAEGEGDELLDLTAAWNAYRELDKTPYQIVLTSEARISPSQLMSGSPRQRAVAAMMRSGMSGTSLREIS